MKPARHTAVRLLSLFGALLLAVSCWAGAFSAFAEDEEPEEPLKYSVNSSGTAYTVSGVNDYTLASITVPATHEGLPVTAIGDNAFRDWKKLTSITLPEGIKSIGNYAFYGCAGLSSVTLPASCTTLGVFPFAHTTGLTQIRVADGNTAFRSYDGVLYNAAGTKLVACPAGKTGSYTVRSGVTAIEGYAFDDCALREILLPSGLKTIGSYAFSASKIESITIPSGVTTLSLSLFENCKSLVTVNLPSTIQSMGENVFCGCTALKSIELPDNLKTLYLWAFDGCTALESVKLPAKLTGIANYAFQNCKSLKSLTIPESVEGIGRGAFLGCTSLKTLSFSSSVLSVGKRAFYKCSGLTDVYFDLEAPGHWEANWDEGLTAKVHWKNEPEETLFGDINLDGTLSIGDVSRLLLMLEDDSAAENLSRCDIYTDGTANITDATMLIVIIRSQKK